MHGEQGTSMTKPRRDISPLDRTGEVAPLWTGSFRGHPDWIPLAEPWVAFFRLVRSGQLEEAEQLVGRVHADVSAPVSQALLATWRAMISIQREAYLEARRHCRHAQVLASNEPLFVFLSADVSWRYIHDQDEAAAECSRALQL